jgi:hypothetical protein
VEAGNGGGGRRGPQGTSCLIARAIRPTTEFFGYQDRESLIGNSAADCKRSLIPRSVNNLVPMVVYAAYQLTQSAIQQLIDELFDYHSGLAD